MSEDELRRLIELSIDVYSYDKFEIGLMGSYFNGLRIDLENYIIVEERKPVTEEFEDAIVTYKPIQEHYLYMGIKIVNMRGTKDGYVVTRAGVLS